MTSDFFAKPRLTGARFEAKEIPVHFLPTLDAYRALVLEVARRLVIDRNGRERAPKGFVESFSLTLTDLEPGSAVPVLVQKLGAGQDQEEWATIFADARELVSDAIDAVNDQLPLPVGFAPELLPHLEKLGDRLHEGEAIEFFTPSKRKRSKTPTFTRATFEAIRSRSTRPEPSRQQFRATVVGVHTQRRSCDLHLESGAVESGRYDLRLESRLLVALTRRRHARGLVEAQVLIDRVGAIVKVEELLNLTVESRTEEAVVTELEKRLDVVRDAESLSERGLDWVRTLLVSLVADEGLPKPAVFSGDDGVRAEWSVAGWSISIDFAIAEQTAWVHALQLQTNEEWEQTLNMGDVRAHPRKTLVELLTRHLPVANWTPVPHA